MTPAPPAPSALQQDEAVCLGYALVDGIATDAGIRALAIKGPVPAAHGLIPPRQSVDVDVVVPPDDHPRLKARLQALGWVPVEQVWTSSVLPSHSTTLRHPRWPCEIDLHDRFPGMLTDPESAFDALWRERRTVVVAGRAVRAVGPAGAALVAALHSLRAPDVGRSAYELDQLVQSVGAGRVSTAALLELVQATGAVRTAAPLLTRLSLPVPDDGPDSPELAAWELKARLSGTTTAGLGWVLPLRAAPLRKRLPLLWQALVGNPAGLRQFGASADGSGVGRARLRRIAYAVRRLPASLVRLYRDRALFEAVVRQRAEELRRSGQPG